MLTTHLSMALPIDCIIVNGPIKSISISRNGIISLEEIECEYDPQKKALSLKQRKGVQIRSMSGITYIGRHKIFKLNISTCNFLSISGVGSVNVDTSTLNGYDCTINASNAVIKLIGVENLNKLNVNLQDSSKFFESSKGMISELNVDCGYGSILYFENKRKETIITRSSSTVCCSEGSGFSIYQEGGQISRESKL